MKKQFFGMLVLVALSMALTANGNEETASAGEGTVKVNPAGVLPVTDELSTLSAFISQNSQADDFDNNLFTYFMEERTNVHIDWNVASAADYKTKLNLIVAAGEYPDMFIHAPWTLTQLQVLGTDKVLLPLNDLIDEYGETSKVIYSRFPRLKKILTLSGGNIYSMPAVTGAYHAQAQGKFWIYMPWLDTLGLDAPETTEDFYRMLKAFKENDPNGNGKADEIPMAGAVNGWNTKVAPFIMCAFIYDDGKQRMRALDGEISVSYDKEEWREGLRFIKRLYDEELIATESFTQTGDQLKQLGENPDAVILGSAPAGYMGSLTQNGGESGRYQIYKTIAPLMGPAGVRTTPFIADMGLTDRICEAAISSQCENPAVAFRYAEFMYTKEATLFADNGIEGENWEFCPPGTKAIDGTDEALYFKFDRPQINVSWGNLTPRYAYFPEYHSKQKAVEGSIETTLYQETEKNYMPYVPAAEEIVPIMAFSEENAVDVAEMESQLLSYVEEMVARFITGDADLDSDWEAYLRELENIGLNRYVALYQDAYDRMFN